MKKPKLPALKEHVRKERSKRHYRAVYLTLLILPCTILLQPNRSPPKRESDDLFTAHLQARETCKQWISAQRVTKSYLDAYIIGTQKGATSELTKRLHKLGVRRGGLGMIKEWQFFNMLTAEGRLGRADESYSDFAASNLDEIRELHHRSGHRGGEALKLVDDAVVENRSITYDGSVEYSHSDRSAFLAHLITPHAKIVYTIREPIERAISQYNMLVRTYNSRGGTAVATRAYFHNAVSAEIAALRECGYDDRRGVSRVSTSKLGGCVRSRVKDGSLYILRGLYHLHISSWLEYFPRHRMLFIRFEDILRADKEVFDDLSRFLCVRRFPEAMVAGFREQSSLGVSFGRQQVLLGVSNGTDDDLSGLNRYMDGISRGTRGLLEEFYRAANARLAGRLGAWMYSSVGRTK